MNKRSIYPAIAAFLAAFFLGCAMPGPDPAAVPGADGKAPVRIGLEAAGLGARTALPLADLTEVTRWELRGKKSAEAETKLADFSGAAATVYLEPGAWDFTLEGYKGDDPILRGSINGKTITLEGPNVLSFTVAPIPEGSGTYKITVKLPSDHGITKAKVFQDGIQGDADPSFVDPNTVVFEKTLPAGDYYFSLRLFKGDELYGVVSEMVQVRQNLKSEKEYSLALADLNRTYLISYHLNDGEGVAPSGDYRATDVDFTLPKPTRTGYIFGGWYTDAGYNETEVAEIPQGSTEDKNFYAKWKFYFYTVSFDKNDGNAEADPDAKTIVSPATTIDALPASPTRSGYNFAGWNTKADGSGSAFDDTTTVSGDMAVYAQWNRNPGVTLTVTPQPKPGDPSISVGVTELFEDETANFSVAAEYTTYQWYWDGQVLPGAAAAAYTLAANSKSPGIHELSVKVTTGDAMLSARRRVVIKAR
jgi:uncharacterized repeat protein (TIGR02543 family)